MGTASNVIMKDKIRIIAQGDIFTAVASCAEMFLVRKKIAQNSLYADNTENTEELIEYYNSEIRKVLCL